MKHEDWIHLIGLLHCAAEECAFHAYKMVPTSPGELSLMKNRSTFLACSALASEMCRTIGVKEPCADE